MTDFESSHVFQSQNNQFHITVLESSPSTNTALKELAQKGAPEGTVLVTEHQTAGRGRLGKSFYSPKSCGLYFSLLLRPDISAENAVFITVAAAVSVKRAVKALLDIDTQIKWVNDIYFKNKKFCGILTEAALTPQGTLAYAVLGIGINLLPPPEGYPEEFSFKTTNLEAMAGTLPADFKTRLLHQILTEFDICYRDLAQKQYLAEYKSASCVIGKDIEVLTGPYQGRAFAKDIDDSANLVVTLPGGETVSLSSGDVSIHL